MIRSIVATVLGICCAAVAPSAAHAWIITNETSRTYDGVARLPNTAPILLFTVGPNAQYVCDWNLPNCNPQKPTLDTNDLLVTLTDSDGRTFECQVRMEAAGKVHVRAHARALAPTGLPPVADNFYCASMFGGAYVDSSDPFAGVLGENQVPALTESNREVKFIAAGDPQYNNSDIDGSGNTSGDAADSDDMLIVLTNLLGSDDDYRGVIVNGDLTQNARGDNDGNIIQSGDELEAYLQMIGPESRMYFEGLGNHDVESTGESSAPEDVREYVHEKPRSTIRSFSGSTGGGTDPHYSWDWHDVHFVQLNMMAADSASTDLPDLDPRDALTWLQADLQLVVGDTGRPVVLNHHYGFDDFSIGANGDDTEWWTGPQRAAYWNVIRDYNVVAIFTGHDHRGPTSGVSAWIHEFDQPTVGDSAPIIPLARPDGRSCIPTFNGAAIRSGAALEVSIDGVEVTVERRGEIGITADRKAHYNMQTMTSFGDADYAIDCPEPGAAVSMTSGLALLCALARRRQRVA